MVFKAKWTLRGVHIHVTIFVARSTDHTYENMGTLVMSPNQWVHFGVMLDTGNVQIVEGYREGDPHD